MCILKGHDGLRLKEQRNKKYGIYDYIQKIGVSLCVWWIVVFRSRFHIGVWRRHDGFIAITKSIN